MRWSRFNRLVATERHGWLLYNALTNALLRVDEDALDAVERIRAEPDGDALAAQPALALQLMGAKALVDEAEEEALVKLAHARRLCANYDTRVLGLSPLTTYACNFDCPYCFERSRPPIHMTAEVEDAIVAFARRFDHAQTIALSWFGGEPLIRFATMCSLTAKLEELGLPLRASLTTNGYLLRDRVVERLDDLHVTAVQVTLDGPQAVHDRRRVLRSGRGTFTRIMANLDRLLAGWGGTLNIRVNIDRENAGAFPALYRELRERYDPRRVVIGTGMVVPEQGETAGPCHLARDDACTFHLRAHAEHGIDELLTYPTVRQGCMATHRTSWVIDPLGAVYKCLLDVGDPDLVVGSVMDARPWNVDVLTRYLVDSDPFTRPACAGCAFLPSCDGGCANVRVRGLPDESPNACPVYHDRLGEYLDAYLDIRDARATA